jgi:hypothetical protein
VQVDTQRVHDRQQQPKVVGGTDEWTKQGLSVRAPEHEWSEGVV